jgi:hypothetical protein
MLMLHCRPNKLCCQSLKIMYFPFKVTNKRKPVLKLDSGNFDSKITVYD